jgi:hypothetical protein
MHGWNNFGTIVSFWASGVELGAGASSFNTAGCCTSFGLENASGAGIFPRIGSVLCNMQVLRLAVDTFTFVFVGDGEPLFQGGLIVPAGFVLRSVSRVALEGIDLSSGRFRLSWLF